MRALQFSKYGPPTVLALADVPVPGAGEALVHVRATAINPSDVKNVAGGDLRPPSITPWPLDRAVEAYEAVARAKPRGKHVLLPAAPPLARSDATTLSL